MINPFRYWPPLLHLTVLGVLIPLAVFQWQITPELPPTSALAPATENATQIKAMGSKAEEELAAPPDWTEEVAEIIARPLFRQGRQIAKPALLVEPDPLPEVESSPAAPLRMVGYVDSGFAPFAIIFVPDEGIEYLVRKGDKIAEMTVISIEPSKVFLSSDSREVTLELYGK